MLLACPLKTKYSWGTTFSTVCGDPSALNTVNWASGWNRSKLGESESDIDLSNAVNSRLNWSWYCIAWPLSSYTCRLLPWKPWWLNVMIGLSIVSIRDNLEGRVDMPVNTIQYKSAWQAELGNLPLAWVNSNNKIHIIVKYIDVFAIIDSDIACPCNFFLFLLYLK